MEHLARSPGTAHGSYFVDQPTSVECFPWIQPRSKVNRLEVRAALSMSMNVLPFWLLYSPSFLQRDRSLLVH